MEGHRLLHQAHRLKCIGSLPCPQAEPAGSHFTRKATMVMSSSRSEPSGRADQFETSICNTGPKWRTRVLPSSLVRNAGNWKLAVFPVSAKRLATQFCTRKSGALRMVVSQFKLQKRPIASRPMEEREMPRPRLSRNSSLSAGCIHLSRVAGQSPAGHPTNRHTQAAARRACWALRGGKLP